MGTLDKYVSMLNSAALAGSESARVSLSRLLGKEIKLADIEVVKRPLTELPEMLGGAEVEMTVILMELSNKTPGNILLIIYHDSALNIAGSLVRNEDIKYEDIEGTDYVFEGENGLDVNDEPCQEQTSEEIDALIDSVVPTDETQDEEFDEMDLSALEETGNIMLTAFLNAIAGITGVSLEPEPPRSSSGPCGALMDYIMITYDELGDECVFLKTGFLNPDFHIKAHILFLPFPETSDKLAGALGSEC